MTHVSKTSLAETDLLELWLYVARDNLVAADAVLDSIEKSCSLLATQPLMGRARPELGFGLRSFPCLSYVVFYAADEGGIRILRVLHGARDVASEFLRPS